MRSFKDYNPEPEKEAKKELKTQAQASAAGDANSAAAELTRKIAAAYNGKNSGDMLRGILAEAERSKRAGTLSNAEIDAFYEQFAPLLDGVQRRRLKSVVERLKRI